jgi:hypothetical protein
MEAFSTFVKVQLPKYLRSLPLSNTVDGLAKLKASDDFIALAPFFLTLFFLLYAVVKLILPKDSRPAPPVCNPEIRTVQ